MDIDHSGSRLCRLLLRSLLIRPVPPSPPAVRYTDSPAITFRPGSAQGHPPTWASPVSVPSHQKTFTRLSFTCHFQRRTPPLLPIPYHTFQIPVGAAPMLPPKSLLTWISDVIPQLPVATTNPPPPPCNLYPSHIPRR